MIEFPHRLPYSLFAVLTSVVLSACQPPEKNRPKPTKPAEPEPPKEVMMPETTVAPQPEVPPTSVPPRPAPERPTPIQRVALPDAPKPIFRPEPEVTARAVAILKENSEWPELIVEETEPTNPGDNATLKIQGEMRNEIAFQSTIARLHEALPGHRIVVEVRYGPHIRTTDWSGRLDTLWGTFFHQVSDGTWKHANNVTTLQGTADSAFAIESLKRLHKNVITGSESQRVDSVLVAP